MEDMLNFTDKYYFKKMIFDGGKSAIFIKNIFILLSLLSIFGFFITRCMGHIPKYNHTKIGIILIIIFFVALYSTKKYLTPLIFKYKSRNWKKITAKLITNKIIKIKIIARHGSYIGYYPYVKYEFLHNNKKFVSDNFSFESELVYNISLDENRTNKEHKTNKIFSKWIYSKEIDIYYNPYDPRQSVVLRNFHPLRTIFYTLMSTLSIPALFISIFNIICFFKQIT